MARIVIHPMLRIRDMHRLISGSLSENTDCPLKQNSNEYNLYNKVSHSKCSGIYVAAGVVVVVAVVFVVATTDLIVDAIIIFTSF